MPCEYLRLSASASSCKLKLLSRSVYLVREILYEPDLTDDMLSPIDPLASFDFDSPHTAPPNGSQQRPRLHSWASEVLTQPEPTYGKYYALKCLCKKDLTDELIEVQRGEAVLHRALPKHENIVQLYGVSTCRSFT